MRAYEIQLATSTDQSTGTSDATVAKVDVMHILYSPNGDASSASGLDPNDPGWAAAKAKADATVAKLRAIADLSTRRARFQAVAKTDSNDTGSGASGGELGFQTQASYVTEFGAAIFNGSHTYGEIIGPVDRSTAFTSSSGKPSMPPPRRASTTWPTSSSSTRRG